MSVTKKQLDKLGSQITKAVIRNESKSTIDELRQSYVKIEKELNERKKHVAQQRSERMKTYNKNKTFLGNFNVTQPAKTKVRRDNRFDLIVRLYKEQEGSRWIYTGSTHHLISLVF